MLEEGMQQGSRIRGGRKRGPDVWQFRWADREPNGIRIYRKRVIGTLCQYPDTDSARQAVKRLLREINSGAVQRFRHPMTVSRQSVNTFSATSAKEVVQEFWRLEAEGERLTSEGLEIES